MPGGWLLVYRCALSSRELRGTLCSSQRSAQGTDGMSCSGSVGFGRVNIYFAKQRVLLSN